MKSNRTLKKITRRCINEIKNATLFAVDDQDKKIVISDALKEIFSNPNNEILPELDPSIQFTVTEDVDYSFEFLMAQISNKNRRN